MLLACRSELLRIGFSDILVQALMTEHKMEIDSGTWPMAQDEQGIF